MTAILPTLDCPCDPRGLGGLVARGLRSEHVFPLRSVRVRTQILGTFARTVVEERFGNPLQGPMEAVHTFPLPEDGAVVEMELRCGETIVRAECRERAEAEAHFENARRSGHRAALLTQERPDIHTLCVTNLPPGEEVTVRIVVVEQLESEDGFVRFRFPTTVAPRYNPGNPVGHDGHGSSPDTDRVPDASRISPPIRLEGGTTLDVEVTFDRVPARLSSSLHALRMEFDGGLRVAPNGTATCDRDFVLAFAAATTPNTAVEAWTDGELTLVVVQPPAVAIAAIPRDAVFVVDISGSMGGGKMLAAKLALRTALRGLNPGDRFRIVAFDDRVEEYRPDFVSFGSVELAGAEQFVNRLQARGGTEMKAPLVRAFAGERPAGRLRTVLFVTDGQAGNEHELVPTVANHARGARLFTLGIDTAVNAVMLKRFASVGGGACTLCTPDDDIEAVVARIEARFGSPVADEVRLLGDAAAPGERSLFAGKPLSMWVRGKGPVQITARLVAGPVEWTCTPAASAFSLAPGFAQARVAWLEDRLAVKPFEEDAILPEILRVALAGGIASRRTAFVAVETSRTVTGERCEVVQPVELPHQWDRAFSGAPAGAAPPPRGATLAYSPAPSRVAGAASMRSRPSAPQASVLRDSPHFAGPVPHQAAKPKARGADMIDRVRAALLGGPGSAPPADEDVFFADEPPRASMAAPMAPPPRSPVPAAPSILPSFPGRASSQRREGPPDPLVALVQSQDADGSWGADVVRTVSALRLFIAAGHTRLHGVRKRSVAKAARWLAGRAEADALKVLAELAEAESRLG